MKDNKLNKGTSLGEIYRETLLKGNAPEAVEDVEKEFNKDYMSNLITAARGGHGKYLNHTKYYVCVLMKRERLMKNVLRNYFFTRLTCPSPSHDLTVYSYDSETEELEFLWLIPDERLCKEIYAKRYSHPNSITPYVVDFMEARTSKDAIKRNIKARGK
jgi:carboxypeptidase C (cathepsin A)